MKRLHFLGKIFQIKKQAFEKSIPLLSVIMFVFFATTFSSNKTSFTGQDLL